MNINEQLFDALKKARGSLAGFKFIPGDANAWEPHDEHALADADKAIAAAELAQQGGSAAYIRAMDAGLRDGMGGHADACADLMEQLANGVQSAAPCCA